MTILIVTLPFEFSPYKTTFSVDKIRPIEVNLQVSNGTIVQVD